jgi:hypothetical protein
MTCLAMQQGNSTGTPSFFASTASEGRFTAIHARLSTPGKFSLTTERRIMERLKRSFPYSLYAFSDAEAKLWHFVNAPLDAGTQGPGERFRKATERISLLSVDDLAESSGREPEDLTPLPVHAAHDKAFDVEEVTKEFFRMYRRVFENVEEHIMGIDLLEDGLWDSSNKFATEIGEFAD